MGSGNNHFRESETIEINADDIKYIEENFKPDDEEDGERQGGKNYNINNSDDEEFFGKKEKKVDVKSPKIDLMDLETKINNFSQKLFDYKSFSKNSGDVADINNVQQSRGGGLSSDMNSWIKKQADKPAEKVSSNDDDLSIEIVDKAHSKNFKPVKEASKPDFVTFSKKATTNNKSAEKNDLSSSKLIYLTLEYGIEIVTLNEEQNNDFYSIKPQNTKKDIPTAATSKKRDRGKTNANVKCEKCGVVRIYS
jgi:hypothetical protein